MTKHTSALIVAPPGVLREGLRAAMGALHDLETVGEADSVAQALAGMHDPALVLLSMEGAGDLDLAGIREIRGRWPATRCIVLVDTVAQQRAARSAGAEEVLVMGVLPQKLLGRIERMLGEPGAASLPGESTNA